MFKARRTQTPQIVIANEVKQSHPLTLILETNEIAAVSRQGGILRNDYETLNY